jgi:hypothetical protein
MNPQRVRELQESPQYRSFAADVPGKALGGRSRQVRKSCAGLTS